MPLTQIQTLRAVDPPLSPAFWRKTFVHLRGLRYIELNDGNMPDLASVLSPTAHEDEDNKDAIGDDSDHILVPHLEELELSRIRFSWGDYMPRHTIIQRCLFDALSSRDMSRGRLTMTQCWIGRCETPTADVVRTWDGVEVVVGDSATED